MIIQVILNAGLSAIYDNVQVATTMGQLVIINHFIRAGIDPLGSIFVVPISRIFVFFLQHYFKF